MSQVKSRLGGQKENATMLDKNASLLLLTISGPMNKSRRTMTFKNFYWMLMKNVLQHLKNIFTFILYSHT